MPDFKISKYVEEMVGIWLEWVENDNRLRNSKLGWSKRRAAGEYIEQLVDRRNKLNEELDTFFQKLMQSKKSGRTRKR